MLEVRQSPNPKAFWVALALMCWFVLTQSRTAAAQVHWGVHVGGGIEGGTISNEPRPDDIIEAGTIVEYLLPKRNWGFAAIVEQVARQTEGYDQHEELKADLLVRFASSNHKSRFGLGAGIRSITQEKNLEQSQQTHLPGLDIFRIDASHTLVGWQPAPVAPTLLLEAYGSWTIGCYARNSQIDHNELPTRAIGCGDTLTTAYVFGIRTTATWR